MGVIYNPKIVTDGLIACFDPANPRGKESSSALLNFAQVPDVPIPPQSALQLRLSGCETPEIFTDVSPTFPAKNPSNPKSNSFGFSKFIHIVSGILD